MTRLTTDRLLSINQLFLEWCIAQLFISCSSSSSSSTASLLLTVHSASRANLLMAAQLICGLWSTSTLHWPQHILTYLMCSWSICQYLKLWEGRYRFMAFFAANSDKTFWFHNQWTTFSFLSMLLRYLWSWGEEMNFNITAEEEIALSLLDAKTLHGLCLCLLKAIV